MVTAEIVTKTEKNVENGSEVKKSLLSHMILPFPVLILLTATLYVYGNRSQVKNSTSTTSTGATSKVP